jgi:hypothetical protein
VVALFGVMAVLFTLGMLVCFVAFMAFLFTLSFGKGEPNRVRYVDDWHDETLDYAVVDGRVRLDLAD